MTEYLPSLQTYLYASASVYFTYMTTISMYNKVRWFLQDRALEKEFAQIEAEQAAIKEEKVVVNG